MAYPTGTNWQHRGIEVGWQPIQESSTTQNHPLGTIAIAEDVTYGVAKFVYAKGVASTAKGDFCTIDSKNGDTARAVVGGATSTGPGGVAMSDNVASQYGWYMTEGACPVATGTVAADAPLYLTSTAGSLDDAAVVGSLVTGIVARSATSSGFTTCQLAEPSIEGLGGGGGITALRQITLSAATEATDAIVVTGAVLDGAGTAITAATQVLVRSLAITDNKGDITVTAGTSKKVVNPATGENVAWIETTAAGAFAVSIANDVAEATLVQVTADNALAATLKLTFT